MKEKLIIGKVQASRLFLIFLRSRFQCEGKDKKQTFSFSSINYFKLI